MIALILAAAFSFTYSLLLTPLFVRGFRKLHWGQFIREDGPKSHYAKRGTPTMGGLVFISGSIIAYLLAKFLVEESPTETALLVLFVSFGCGVVGFIDDYLKTRKQQSLGLGGWAKILGQCIVGAVFALLALRMPDKNGLTPVSTSISFFRDLPFDFLTFGVVVGTILLVAWIVLITISTTNAVNLTDGLDGLATGVSIFVLAAYVIIGFWQASQNCAVQLEPACYMVRNPLDIAVVAAAFLGGIAGFLWWNTSPALLYMGDTGSMAIGGAIAALAIVSRTELLLIILGGVFLMEAGSVILQRLYFKATGGKRIFRMSPIHHHFELKGWQEVTVVVRFWIIAGVFVMIGIGLFYAEWIINDGFTTN